MNSANLSANNNFQSDVDGNNEPSAFDQLEISASALTIITSKDEARADSEKTKNDSTNSIPEADGEPRDMWGSHTSYIFTCIGYVVGLGNVSRFPYLCYKFGGGAFLIPYFLFLILLGVPIYFLEIFIGQYAGVGTVSIMEINPLFKGLGWTTILLCAHFCIYYTVDIAISIYFVFSSFQFTLPWSRCDNEWNTCYCKEINIEYLYERNDTEEHSCKDIIVTSETRTSPTQEFFNNKLLEKSSGLTEPGGLKWDLTLCNLIIWLCIFFIIIRGIRSIAKVAYVSTTLPYFLLALILIKCATLPGAGNGIFYYLAVDLEKITHVEVWRTAASQVMFSLSCSFGAFISLASYNKFHANCIRDSITIPLVDCFTSLYAGFAVFAALGHMAKTTGRDMDNVVVSGPGLVFEVYPLVLAELPLANMWTILFFLMVVLLGLSSQFPFMEAIVTSIQDEFPYWRKSRKSIILRFILCMAFFTLGLFHTTRGGRYLSNIFDTSLGFCLLSVGLLEVVVFVPMYGLERFADDVNLMLGYSVWNMRIFQYYLRWTLVSFTPLILVTLIVTYIVEYKPISSEPGYPAWAEYVSWSLIAIELICVPFGAIGQYCYRGGYKLLKDLTHPTAKWRPNLPKLSKIDTAKADKEKGGDDPRRYTGSSWTSTASRSSWGMVSSWTTDGRTRDSNDSSNYV